MAEIDPYAVLGVSRTATRSEIARAYRRLAKQHHPDAGAPASPTMARINEAWHVLSDANRRDRWDRRHAPLVARPPQWAAAPAAADIPRRPPAPQAAPSVRDSGWLALAVVAGVAAAVLALLVVIGATTAASPQADPSVATFEADGLRFEHPAGWIVGPGEDATDGAGHAVVAHLVSFETDTDLLCVRFGQPCDASAGGVPPGEVSILITAWEGGTPPVPDPVRSRPFGLDAERFIGGEPAAFELTRTSDGAVAWYQLSPPGFPDRWFEVRAEIGGQRFEQDDLVRGLDEILQTLEFTEDR